MQLTLTHADITKALCAHLQAQGMTAFDPTVVTAEFAFKRGTKELTCTLDTEAPVVVAEAPKQSDVTQSVTGSAPVVEAPVTVPAAAAVEPVETAQAETPVTTTSDAGAQLETAGAGDDDNLFD